MQYFNYCQGLTMTSRRFDELFGGPPRNPESDIEQRHMDLAASIQAVTEEVMLRDGPRAAPARPGMKNLVLAGGVALNCVANGRLLREGPFDDIWIQPAAGDAGGALGAALFVWHQLLDKPRPAQRARDSQKGSFLGPRVLDATRSAVARRASARVSPCGERAGAASTRSSTCSSHEKIVGWFQGRMEFGPRALGARSIIGDPRSPKMQATMNLKIKFRESFRPFAPIVLRDEAHEVVRRSIRARRARTCCSSRRCSSGIACRSPTRSAQHDGERSRTCATASTSRGRHSGRDARRLQRAAPDGRRGPQPAPDAACSSAFYAAHRLPGARQHQLQRPRRADRLHARGRVSLFPGTEMDALVLEDVVLLKEDVAEKLDAAAREKYLAQFQLD